jgi:16S rRNA (guanine1207-N2)-methyltransferase
MTTDFDPATLRRWPDLEAENLHAHDATDRLILDLAAPLVGEARTIAVIGDNYGALTLGLLAEGASATIRVHQDGLLGERALAANAARAGFAGSYESHPLSAGLLEGATLVLVQLPRSLAELDEVLSAIARWADPSVVVIAGGRIKHLTPTMNPVMQRHFASLEVSRAQQKSRAFTLRSAIAGGEQPFPVREFHADLGLWVSAHGAVFAGSGIDIGTRLLLGALAKAAPTARTAIDLGCGSGVLAAALALARPELRVIATDQSAAAVASAAETAVANAVDDRVAVVRDDGLESQPDASADLIVLNPPFHLGATVHTGIALRLFSDAARVLRPGGELWTVFNTHLGYRRALAHTVGPTDLVTHNAKFTVTMSRRAP